MGRLIGIMGASGQGKSTSLHKLNNKETFIINTAGKDLPFKGYKSLYPLLSSDNPTGNLINTSDYNTILKTLDYINTKRPEIKNVIWDDSTYAMSFLSMARAQDKGYEKFTEMASKHSKVLTFCKDLREDLNIFVLGHIEKGDDGNIKMKTIGKMLDNTVYIDGLFTVVLQAQARVDKQKNKIDYIFLTQSIDSTCKSPMGMFEDLEIPNDLSYVIDKMNEYYS